MWGIGFRSVKHARPRTGGLCYPCLEVNAGWRGGGQKKTDLISWSVSGGARNSVKTFLAPLFRRDRPGKIFILAETVGIYVLGTPYYPSVNGGWDVPCS